MSCTHGACASRSFNWRKYETRAEMWILAELEVQWRDFQKPPLRKRVLEKPSPGRFSRRDIVSLKTMIDYRIEW